MPVRQQVSLADIPPFVEPLHVGQPNTGDRINLLRRINEILDRRWFTNDGPTVRELEAKIAEMSNVKHCVAMCNATIALEVAIRALELEGEVIVPSYTFVATAHALQWQGITPVFADIEEKTHNLDPKSVERLITPRTTGVIGVHLWGRPCDTEALEEIANRKGLCVLYDAAHAIGGKYRGRRIGGFGRCEVFSFHATKFVNSFEGGAVVTNDDLLAEKMRLMRNFGFAGYDRVIYPGTNGKMTEVCAAMGLCSLEAMDKIIQTNRRNHTCYRQALEGVGGLELLEYDGIEGASYQYVVVEVDPELGLSMRDKLVEILHSKNVLARKYFWPGCHRMEPYRSLQPNAGLMLPITEKVAERVIVLPTGSMVGENEIETICSILGAGTRSSPLSELSRI